MADRCIGLLWTKNVAERCQTHTDVRFVEIHISDAHGANLIITLILRLVRLQKNPDYMVLMTT